MYLLHPKISDDSFLGGEISLWNFLFLPDMLIHPFNSMLNVSVSFFQRETETKKSSLKYEAVSIRKKKNIGF